jgi:hypothetical protein
MFLNMIHHLPMPSDSSVTLIETSGFPSILVIALMASMFSGTTIDS